MRSRVLVFCYLLLSMWIAPVFAAGQTPTETISAYLDEKSKLTGKFDFYDEQANIVRNLKLIEVKPAAASDAAVQHVVFRDFQSGDVVTMEFTLAQEAGAAFVQAVKILTVEAPKVVTQEEYSVEEIQQKMMDYLKLKSKYTGSFDVFDEKQQKLRRFEVGAFQGEVRHFGNTHIAAIAVKDLDTQADATLDITAKVENGQLSVSKVKLNP